MPVMQGPHGRNKSKAQVFIALLAHEVAYARDCLKDVHRDARSIVIILSYDGTRPNSQAEFLIGQPIWPT